MVKRRLKNLVVLGMCCMVFCVCACKGKEAEEKIKVPDLPEKIDAFESGVPLLDVYVVQEEAVRRMGLEEYLCGVVAGEMNGDWPLEALKAQAILARTFVLRFMTEKQSKYEGADISTDIEEAQAYHAQAINDRIREAVESTRGLALSFEGEFPYAWFHAHSGGQTAGAIEGLNWKAEEPGYTVSAEGREKDEAAWEAAFDASGVRKAAQECGARIGEIQSIEMGEKGRSGRLLTLLINDTPVSAADFRVAIGSEKMKSTRLTELTWKDATLHLSGKGYGHGVGMSQWGAREMALQGADAETIIDSYFRNIAVVKVY